MSIIKNETNIIKYVQKTLVAILFIHIDEQFNFVIDMIRWIKDRAAQCDLTKREYDKKYEQDTFFPNCDVFLCMLIF